jgi:prepilin-type N-terminal cleavage/methylation domain-containing protein
MGKSENAFTLTELLIVITIIGVMATLILPRYFPQTEKSRIAEAMQILSSLRQGETAYFVQNGGYLTVGVSTSSTNETQFGQLGIERPVSSSFIYRVEVRNTPSPPVFLAIAQRINASNASYNNKYITLDQDGHWNHEHIAGVWSGQFHPLVEAT